MAIQKIDTSKCIGCETCVKGCPCDILRMDEKTGKSRIAYQRDCQNCHICKYYCPVGAITTDTSMSLPPMVGWS
jgi:NAD-dependent dihydropyrimidine dehydrogenase PreA subunit